MEGFRVSAIRGLASFVLLCLIATATADGVTSASASSELGEWQTATGKPPSKNEFAAVVAACEDRLKNSDKSGPIEGCLADYGLRRVQ